MIFHRLRSDFILVLAFVGLHVSAFTVADEAVGQPALGLHTRTPWTTSRVVGSPDPPPPYAVEPIFVNIQWDRPLYIKPEPGTNDLLVIQQGGEVDQPAKILRVNEEPNVSEASLLLAIDDRLVYGLEFHPNYEQNGYLFVYSNGPRIEPKLRKNRISRFTITDGQCDAESELILIQWRSNGHDGGDLAFGLDGMLYTATGDGTSDSDEWTSAQDVTNLRGSVLRIDVDHPDKEQPYSVPPDNPFLNVPNARPELWAIGLRNPWRIAIDRASGQLWVGNNGQDLWETVHLVQPGENYGWSVYEGSHPFYPNRELGPGKLTDPTIEHHHTVARSITGGVVYTGDQLPDLKGAYIYGDYDTGRIWAARHDGTQLTWHQEIADSPLRIAGFSNSHRGNLLVVDHMGGIHRLVVNPESLKPFDAAAFPRRLSETGLFESMPEHRMAAGVIPYSVNTPGWHDGASSQRFLAIPDDGKMTWADTGGFTCSNGTVLVQTLSLGTGEDARRIETRLMIRQQNEWAGYSYQWNTEQTEAVLVAKEGKDLELSVADHAVSRIQPWRIPSRTECSSCHTRAANFLLGMSAVQLNRNHDYGGIAANQLHTFDHIGLLVKAPDDLSSVGHTVDPYDAAEPLEARARSWLHANCSICHVGAGGGNARILLSFNNSLDAMNIIAEFPQHATFGFTRPRIIAPGEPDQSVMLARISRRGRDQMPPLVSRQVDQRAVRLLTDWIASMESERKFVRDWTIADLREFIPQSATGRSLERGAELFKSSGCGQCHRIGDGPGGIGPSLIGIAERKNPAEILESILAPSAKIEDKYADTILITVDGQIVTGRIESETDVAVVLRSTGTFTESVAIAKEDIEERVLSKVSSMPSGLVNHLQRDELLDLLAYILNQSLDQ